MQRHAVVTGGGGGIGLATARALTEVGCRVTLLGRDLDKLEHAAQTLSGAAAFVCDVTDDEAVTRVFAGIGPVNILVNNAGGVQSASFERTEMAMWRAALDLNLLGCVRTIRAAAPSMRRVGFGRIINIASTAGLKGYPYVSAYVAAKHALVGLTRALALEYAKTGVTVNAVCPGYTDTDLVTRAAQAIADKSGRSTQEARGALAAANPQGRLIMPEEVAAAVVWLASDAAGGVNGSAIPIAGGEL